MLIDDPVYDKNPLSGQSQLSSTVLIRLTAPGAY